MSVSRAIIESGRFLRWCAVIFVGPGQRCFRDCICFLSSLKVIGAKLRVNLDGSEVGKVLSSFCRLRIPCSIVLMWSMLKLRSLSCCSVLLV